MTKLGDRRSKLGGKFRASLGDTTETSALPIFPDSEDKAEERKAKKLQYQTGKQVKCARRPEQKPCRTCCCGGSQNSWPDSFEITWCEAWGFCSHVTKRFSMR